MDQKNERKRANSFRTEEKDGLAKRTKVSNKGVDGGQDETAESDITHLSPQQMIKIVEDLREYTCQSTANGYRKFSTFLGSDALQLPDNIDVEIFKSDLRRYFKEATMYSSVSLKTALDVLSEFLKDGRSLALDPRFPKKPLNAYMIFQKNMMARSGGDFVDSVSKIAAQWKDKNFAEERQAAEEEARRLMKVYGNQLIKFRDATEDLPQEHITYINKQISFALKTCNADEKGEKKISALKSKKQKPTKNPKTPFDLFVLSVGDKYDGLTPEKREKKLRKKFSKLSEEELLKFENLSRVL